MIYAAEFYHRTETTSGQSLSSDGGNLSPMTKHINAEAHQ
jgi:hypothetical protein